MSEPSHIYQLKGRPCATYIAEQKQGNESKGKKTKLCPNKVRRSYRGNPLNILEQIFRLIVNNVVLIAWDKSKKLPDHLGPPSRPFARASRPSGTSHYLVVCRATNHLRDGFIFRDFLGYCTFLKSNGVEGAFLSCFPIEQHFVYLKNQFNIDDIKSGQLGSNQNYLASYAWHQWVTRSTNFFEQVGPSVLKSDVVRWITDRTKRTTAGDVVNMIFECHSRPGAMVLGEQYLTSSELTNLVREFPPRVQVNMVSGVCSSGCFVNAIRADGQSHRYFSSATSDNRIAWSQTRSASNRIRNSRYSQAVVMSLARIAFPGVSETTPPTTLGDHENFIKETLKRNITPGSVVDPVMSHHSPPLTLETVVEEMIFRDKIDVLYNRRVTSRRKRHEWPTFDEGLLRKLARMESAEPTVTEEVAREARALINYEISKCQIDPCAPEDLGIIEQYCFGKNRRVDVALKILYRRAREQSAVWDIFETLHLRGFVSTNSLRVPMELFASTQAVGGLSWLLGCFSGRTMQRKLRVDDVLNDDLYFVPETWLATMIVRGCADIHRLLDTILATAYIGNLDEEAYAEYKDNWVGMEFTCNPLELAAESTTLPSSFGFWLPHGVKGDSVDRFIEEVREHIRHFNRIEQVYKAYFSLSDDELLLEEQQEGFYERFPEKLPVNEVWADKQSDDQ